jgi:hypothetical protein
MATDFRNQAILAASQTQPPAGPPAAVPPTELDQLDVVVPRAPKLTRTPEEMRALDQGNVDVVRKAREGATLSKEQKEYFDAIGQRTDAELADVGKERKQQYWMSLALAGAKMAQSQSPYFAAALAEGLESGLTGFNKARADASEKKARLQTRKEDMILKRYEALKGAQADAVNDMKAGREMTAADFDRANASDEQLFNQATADMRYSAVKSAERTGRAEATTAETEAELLERYGSQEKAAAIALIGAQTAASRAAAAKDRAAAARGPEADRLSASNRTTIFDRYMVLGNDLLDKASKTRDKAEKLNYGLEAQAAFNEARKALSPYSATPGGGGGKGLVYDPVNRDVKPR